MLKDDRAGGGGRRTAQKVPGEPLDICSIKPTTGFYRDGCRNGGREDMGVALAHRPLFDLKNFALGLT
jgi:hypothetical protein